MGRPMYEKLSKMASDMQSMSDHVSQLIADAEDYDLLRLLKKVDAELMDLRHSIDVALRFCRKDRSAY
jgi:predicted CopG family antitoxin